jgi:hypothetical protein
MMKAKRLFVFVAAAALAALSGCLFDTRPADPPFQAGEDAVVLDDPSKVFQAMKQSLETLKDANYERAISERFVFSPTQQDSLDGNFIGTGVYDNWNKTVEMDVLALMLSEAKEISVEFTPSVLINKTTFVRFRVEYELGVINTAAPTDTSRYAGVAQFDVRNEGGNWRLTFWDEVETIANQTTWGYLKGILRLRLNP